MECGNKLRKRGVSKFTNGACNDNALALDCLKANKKLFLSASS